MSLNTGFRRAAFAAALTGLSVLPMFSASAEEVEGSPECAALARRTDADPSAENFKAELNCELGQINVRIKGYNAEAVAARKEAAAARKQAIAERERAAAARKEAKVEGQLADKYAESAARNREITACVEFLTKGVTDGTFNKEDIYQRAGGKEELRKGDTACRVAKLYGYRQGANAKAPAAKL